MFVSDPLNRYLLVWAEPASIPNCKVTAMARPRRAFLVFIIVPFLHFYFQRVGRFAHRQPMRDSGAKGANYFQESEAGGRRAEIRGQKPRERTRIARIMRIQFALALTSPAGALV